MRVGKQEIASVRCRQQPETRLRIGSLPGADALNSYIKLFYHALEADGIALAPPPELDARWLATHADQYDAIHLHWPELAWRSHIPALSRYLLRRSIVGAWRLHQWAGVGNQYLGLRIFVHALAVARAHGIRIIWTFHNSEPHEGFSLIDRLGYRALAHRTDLVIAHDKRAASEFTRRYPAAATPVLMSHGNYDGAFPPPADRASVLSELALDPNLPTLVCPGAIRPYKGLDEAIAAVTHLSQPIQLIIAGSFTDPTLVAKLQHAASTQPHTRILANPMSDQRFADLVHAADGVLLPYSKVTGSGTLLAALTLGTGVIASDLPYFRSILQEEPTAGVLAPPDNPIALADGITTFLSVPVQARSAAARRLAQRYDWHTVIRPVADILSTWARASATSPLHNG